MSVIPLECALDVSSIVWILSAVLLATCFISLLSKWFHPTRRSTSCATLASHEESPQETSKRVFNDITNRNSSGNVSPASSFKLDVDPEPEPWDFPWRCCISRPPRPTLPLSPMAEQLQASQSVAIYRLQGHRPESEWGAGKEPYGERRCSLPPHWLKQLQDFVGDEEWQLLLALRHRVTEIAKDFPDIKSRTDECMLLRYLRARKGNVDAAAKMIKKTLEWERKYDAQNAPFTWDLTMHIALRPVWKPFGVFGRDRDGEPILWDRLGNMDVQGLLDAPDELLMRDEVYRRELLWGILDETYESSGRPWPQFTVVEDLKGGGLKYMKIFSKWMRTINTYEDHCPEVIKRIIIVNAPAVFPVLWTMFEKTLNEQQRRKYVIPTAKDQFQTLCQYIPEDSIPAYLGGKGKTNGDPECRQVICPGGPFPADLNNKMREWTPP